MSDTTINDNPLRVITTASGYDGDTVNDNPMVVTIVGGDSGGGGDELPTGTDRQVIGFDSDGKATAVTLGWAQFSDQPSPPPFDYGVLAYDQTTGEFGFLEVDLDVAKKNSVAFYRYDGEGQLRVADPEEPEDAVNLRYLNDLLPTQQPAITQLDPDNSSEMDMIEKINEILVTLGNAGVTE